MSLNRLFGVPRCVGYLDYLGRLPTKFTCKPFLLFSLDFTISLRNLRGFQKSRLRGAYCLGIFLDSILLCVIDTTQLFRGKCHA